MPLTAFTLESRLMERLSPGDSGRFYELLSEAEEKLLEAGRWRWTRTTITLAPVNGLIVLPEEYVSISGARIGCHAVGIEWEETDYLEDGPSSVCVRGCSSSLVDQGLIAGVRTYELSGGDVSTIDEVSVLVRFAPVAYTLPNQQMLCPSFSALKQAMLAITYEESNDLDRMNGYLMQAIGSLDRQEKAYRGIAKRVNKVKLFGPIPRQSRTQIR